MSESVNGLILKYNLKYYLYVNDFSNWNDWQQFNKEENFKFTTSENAIGEKSFVKWDSNTIIATTFAQKDSIVQNYIESANKQTLHWKFNLNIQSIIMILVGTTFGILGGVIGVNIK